MEHKIFVSASKSLLIAPAGYGKTHAIAECLTHTVGKQLILTHTHAGIASIKEKIKKANIPIKKFHIETITGYAQKYVQAYYVGAVPSREDANLYYSFLITQATNILKRAMVKRSISLTYTGLFVDEYQDCTLAQHELICIVSDILPTRILGDPLQGIFGFKDVEMVNLDNSKHMNAFYDNIHILEEPWRWRGRNEPLGQSLKEIRAQILSKKPIDLKKYPSIEVVSFANPEDLYIPTKSYYQNLSKLLSEKNLLLIHPLSSSINVRLKIISKFKIPISLIESIDDKDFYELSKLFDTITKETIEKVCIEACHRLFNKVGVDTWFNDRGLKNKKDSDDKLVSLGIKSKLDEIRREASFSELSYFLKHMATLKTIRCYRKELLTSICASLQEAEANKKTVYESMTEKRNHIRRVGRKVYGKCIGTTLLTKGLEFDTVVILNAQDFKCPKNLYVALTRASKRLIVFTNNTVLTPDY